MEKILITGGLGFIGSALARNIINFYNHEVLIVDKIGYASNFSSIQNISSSPRLEFVKLDITNSKKLEELIFSRKPSKILHLAAETHVDKSIDSPKEFLVNNILGTYSLLEVVRKYIKNEGKNQKNFIFHHVSTDEVFGDLGKKNEKFNERSNYAPSSPYSATKASSDHLVRAWGRTFNLPYVVTNTSNNYGPYQHPEKLIPHIILCALNGKKLPVYGNGQQIRDWIYVDDHVEALINVLFNGSVGETYNIGGNSERKNIDVIKTICDILDKKKPKKSKSYKELIEFVKDRPGHDLKYSINSEKIIKNLKWVHRESFSSGILKTVEWYLENTIWWKNILADKYKLQRQGSRDRKIQ